MYKLLKKAVRVHPKIRASALSQIVIADFDINPAKGGAWRK
jgi:hypothetical protein